MSQSHPNDPLHGIKLATILEELEQHYGWDGLASRIDINCFKNDPSFKSSLKFLRRTPWARDKVEALYLSTFISNRRDVPQREKNTGNPWRKKT
ncbi:hypothetical protein Maes01_01791 [Microbulbifer aestuariivivens]|uniref:DUF2132 domain-containing protein n=2 Tax=Microbulbifer aestuariivivens TaxID=1908308 RepID=A0ABP9WPV2_9GAMM